MKRSSFAKAAGCMLLLSSFSVVAMAGTSPLQSHPYYIHALSDLRAARWMIQHRPGNWAQTQDETTAVKQIDAAITEIKKASIEDGKDINEHPPVDERNDHKGRLHEASDFLQKARQDVSHDEDNKFAQGLQKRIFKYIDTANDAVNHAIDQ